LHLAGRRPSKRRRLVVGPRDPLEGLCGRTLTLQAFTDLMRHGKEDRHVGLTRGLTLLREVTARPAFRLQSQRYRALRPLPTRTDRSRELVPS
jgi:hypothetical protein